MQFNTPLRYPGGKARLTQYVISLIKMNRMVGGSYAEPYAGGAAIGITLLYLEYVNHFYLNDLNKSVHAFWHSVLNDTDNLCRLIVDGPVTLEERLRQKAVQRDQSATPLELGFSTFFLNRTNRSGIIAGGVIGGNAQTGEWKIDARYNRADLVKRIEKVAMYKSRITLSDMDAADFITKQLPALSQNMLIYLDPPYYSKGKKLYQNHYKHDDHATISRLVGDIRQKWIVSYDNSDHIADLYSAFEREMFALSWSARSRYEGSEIMIFGPNLARPEKVEVWRGVAA